MNAGTKRLLAVMMLCALLLVLTGCAQNQSSDQDLAARTEQQSATPTTMVFNISHQNGPKRMGAITIYGLPGGKSWPSTMPAGDHLGDDEGEDGATTIAAALPGFLNFNQVAKPWVDTSATGSTGGTASGAMTATQNPRADQRVDPNVQVQVPVAAGTAPRISIEGVASKDGQATGGSDTVDQSGEVTVVRALASKVEELAKLLASLKPPATSPAE